MDAASQAFRGLDDLVAERAYLEAAVFFEQRNDSYWNGLAAAATIMEDYQRASEAFEKAINLNPYHSLSLGSYGVVLSETGKVNEAVIALEQAVKINPIFIPLREDLARLYLTQGELTKQAAQQRFIQQIQQTQSGR